MADQSISYDIDIEGSTEPTPGAKQYDIDIDVNAQQREVKGAPADEDEVIIVDDEPAAAPAKAAAAADEDDDPDGDGVSEQEMQEMSDRVRKRINSLTRKRHEVERRAAALASENAAAVALVRQQHEKLKQLSELIGNGEKQYVASTLAALESKVQAAQTELKQALGQGDPDAVVEAQSKLAQAHAEAAQARAYRPVAPTVQSEVEALNAPATPAPTAAANVFEPDPAAKSWMSKNPWFNDSSNREHVRMRNYAIEFANSLEADGYDPIADAKEYYAAINQEMRTRFPEKFKTQAALTQKPAGGRITPTAGGNQAVSPGKKTFTLTASQAQLARRLGIPLAEYAKSYVAMYGNEKKS